MQREANCDQHLSFVARRNKTAHAKTFFVIYDTMGHRNKWKKIKLSSLLVDSNSHRATEYIGQSTSKQLSNNNKNWQQHLKSSTSYWTDNGDEKIGKVQFQKWYYIFDIPFIDQISLLLWKNITNTFSLGLHNCVPRPTLLAAPNEMKGPGKEILASEGCSRGCCCIACLQEHWDYASLTYIAWQTFERNA